MKKLAWGPEQTPTGEESLLAAERVRRSRAIYTYCSLGIPEKLSFLAVAVRNLLKFFNALFLSACY